MYSITYMRETTYTDNFAVKFVFNKTTKVELKNNQVNFRNHVEKCNVLLFIEHL